jgi:putative ABC transport system permease protein
MNIMLVSISERTKEIGIRLAVGARERDILWQFLVEAVLLSLIGGVLGTVVAVVSVEFLASALSLPMAVSVPALLAALGVSTVIGMTFGFLPARRAAQLDPIDALRAE